MSPIREIEVELARRVGAEDLRGTQEGYSVKLCGQWFGVDAPGGLSVDELRRRVSVIDSRVNQTPGGAL